MIEASRAPRYTGIILKNNQPRFTRLHLKLGWAWILLFSAGGLVLEGLHGLKVGLYLDVGNEPRRLMWTLAHAHGTLFGLLHIAFAVTVPHLSSASSLSLMSRVLIVSGALLPVGFFLGGVVIHGGDPGIGVLLVPVGALGLIMVSASVVASMSSAP